MLIKLNFTASKPLYTIFRVITDIINTSSITSIADLQARATSASYNSSLLSNLDATNSFIYRTNNPGNVKAHYAGNTSTKAFTCTLEFSVFDSIATKYYTSFTTTSNSVNISQITGGSLTAGVITGTQMPVTAPDATNTTIGDTLTIGSNPYTNSSYQSNSLGDPFTFWMYITDAGMIHAATYTTGSPTGFPATFNSTTYFQGPYFVSQYSRNDYWNLVSNNILPVVFSTARGTGLGLGSSAYDFSATAGNYHNTEYTAVTANKVPFTVYQIPSIIRQGTETTFPMLYGKTVSMTIDERATAEVMVAATSSTTVANTISYLPLLSTTVGHTIPNATLTGQTFGQHNLGWSLSNNSFAVASGGSITDKLGIYIFNGDYTAGDEYTANGVTYVICPLFSGFSTRIGISLPKA